MKKNLKIKSYHDYIIKDGQFIGEFEKMYKHCEDPWMQSKQPNKYSRMAGILHIKNFGIKSVLECGCGLGYYADWIFKETGIIPKSVDISDTAVKNARKLFPYLDFTKSDITKDLIKYREIDSILFAEILWYILPDIDALIEIMEKEFKDKYLIILQVFYKGSQKYGNEYFTSLNELTEYIPFKLLGSCEATLASDSTIETCTIYEI
ncbi:MAG TPA: nodulation protein S NodS [Cytophagales bacterium]|mgnify:CR=1 FL=1|jgi:SAM-dependent methyltransferase|nr:nodulation protein S NodS [Cytophagales bacterium]